MKKILIIEDNSDVLDNISEILQLSNYNTLVSENARKGIQLAIDEQPDLIICDVMMPEMDGYSALRILSKNQKTMDIPFIFLTAKAEREDFRKGMSLGADDYITKPFTDIELLDAIEVRLKKAKKIRGVFDGTKEGLNSFVNEAKGHQALDQLSAKRQTRTYKKKELIIKSGDFPNFLYFIIKGRVKLFRTNDYGKELITNIATEGEFIGYLPLIKNSSYEESASPLEETEISMIPKSAFIALLHGDRDVSSQLIRMLANNVAEQEERLLRLAYDSVRRRVADALLIIANKTGVSQLKTDFFAIRREDLASMAGTTKETAIRTLADFKDEKLIEMKTSKILITDWKGLKSIPN